MLCYIFIQACAYTIGHMKIVELRKKATKNLGTFLPYS